MAVGGPSTAGCDVAANLDIATGEVAANIATHSGIAWRLAGLPDRNPVPSGPTLRGPTFTE